MPDLSRRRFLKHTVAFSALAAGAAGAAVALRPAPEAPGPPADPGACHLLAVGDFGVKTRDLRRQRAVARGMTDYLARHGLRPSALLLLGDNFYGGLAGAGVHSPRWQSNIEAMYPAADFPCPLYPVLGNHDYSDEPGGACVAAQLAYRAHAPSSRWTMPGKWHAFRTPGAEPLATVLAVDTNFAQRAVRLTPAERQALAAWLAAELSAPRQTPWVFVIGHHPVFSDGKHGDTPALAADLDPLLRRHRVDMYLCGHDHDLQHIEVAGHPTSFVVSGAGGARARRLRGRPRGPFGTAVYGFTHVELRADRFIVRHVDASGRLLHCFTKSPTGKVAIGAA